MSVRLPENVYQRVRAICRRTGLASGAIGRIAISVWSEFPTLQEPTVPAELVEWLEKNPRALALLVGIRQHDRLEGRRLRAIDQQPISTLFEGTR